MTSRSLGSLFTKPPAPGCEKVPQRLCPARARVCFHGSEKVIPTARDHSLFTHVRVSLRVREPPEEKARSVRVRAFERTFASTRANVNKLCLEARRP